MRVVRALGMQGHEGVRVQGCCWTVALTLVNTPISGQACSLASTLLTAPDQLTWYAMSISINVQGSNDNHCVDCL